MNRFKAFAIHLGISFFIGVLILCLMWFVWYPSNMFTLLGGFDILLIILGVDVCLGPLLTLVVFNPQKKSLKFDLSVIALMQILALAYGVYVMFVARPVYLVYMNDVFKVTTAIELTDSERKLASQEKWKSDPLLGPALVAAVLPEGDEKLKKEMLDAALAGKDWNAFPKLYVEYATQKEKVLAAGRSLKTIRDVSNKNTLSVQAFMQKHPNQNEDSFLAFPMIHGFSDVVAIVDAKTAEFVDVIDAESP